MIGMASQAQRRPEGNENEPPGKGEQGAEKDRAAPRQPAQDAPRAHGHHERPARSGKIAASSTISSSRGRASSTNAASAAAEMIAPMMK
jgi:hypothetical protein